MYDKEIVLRKGLLLGYDYFIDKSHPLASGNSAYVYYHRHVASLKIGRWLKPGEHVHHIDGNRRNNNPENIVILTRSEHAQRHKPQKPPIACAVCGRKVSRTFVKKYCSLECSHKGSRRLEWPLKRQLKAELATTTWTAIGKKYGVSDNAVRKWARQYKLL